MKKPLNELDRYLDRYLGLSDPLFTANTFNRIKAFQTTEPDSTHPTHSFESILEFAETEYNHRVTELAQVAAKRHRIPPFRFAFLNARTFDASAIERWDEPLVLLDSSLVTFWFMIFTARAFETYGDISPADGEELNEMTLHTFQCALHRRPYPAELIDRFESWYPRSETISMLANSLTRVVSYFVLLHEIAHLIDDTREAHQAELCADSIALDIFTDVAQDQTLNWASIPDGYMGAPVLFFDILRCSNLIKTETLRWEADTSHPPARLRREQALAKLPFPTKHDRDCLRDLRLSFSRFITRLPRLKPISL